MTSDLNAIEAQGGGQTPPSAPPPDGYGPPAGRMPSAPPGGYGPPWQPPGPSWARGATAGGASGPADPGADLKKQATNWLIIAVATFFLCAGVNCLGVIGAILCFLAMQAAEQGSLADAESKLKWGKIVIVVGTLVSFLILASALLFYVVAQAETFAAH